MTEAQFRECWMQTHLVIRAQSPGPALYQHPGARHVALGSCPVKREPALGVWLVRVSSSLEESLEHVTSAVDSSVMKRSHPKLVGHVDIASLLYQGSDNSSVTKPTKSKVICKSEA